MTDVKLGQAEPVQVLIEPVSNGFIVREYPFDRHMHGGPAGSVNVFATAAELGAFITDHYGGAGLVPGEIITMSADFVTVTAEEKEVLAAMVKLRKELGPLKAEVGPLKDACVLLVSGLVGAGKELMAEFGIESPEAMEALKSMEDMAKRLAAATAK